MSTWTVITVTFNSRAHLERHWLQRDRSFHWIVVDNQSADGTVDLAREVADEVVVLPENVGFSRANNVGLSRVASPYVAFVNPDVSVPPLREWGGRFAELIDDYGALVGPQLTYGDGSVQPNARGLPYLGAKVGNRLRPQSARGREYARAEFQVPTFCAWLMGAAVAGATDSVRGLGGWDERYFLYYEDHDLGLRAWRSGVPVIIDPRVNWVHEWQRETTSLNTRAWRRELQAMRHFYSEYPALLYPRSLRSNSRRLQRAGMKTIADNLWARVPMASPNTRRDLST
ncbi:glycosyltransferase family 2 protein [Nocardioides sp. zg-ZUI104]|uniref:glycosyltransferase n=1 Tax=Nocardioides faecalis TaxID=2803858 RepID=UPI001BD16601|nr:glycosyltransferase family 2 protein [Nocardioides faecalis]